MKQIKIFYDKDDRKVENAVNEFLANDKITLIEIKFSTHPRGSANMLDFFSCLVIYEI